MHIDSYAYVRVHDECIRMHMDVYLSVHMNSKCQKWSFDSRMWDHIRNMIKGLPDDTQAPPTHPPQASLKRPLTKNKNTTRCARANQEHMSLHFHMTQAHDRIGPQIHKQKRTFAMHVHIQRLNSPTSSKLKANYKMLLRIPCRTQVVNFSHSVENMGKTM